MGKVGLEKTLKRFATCPVKVRLETTYGLCHVFFRRRVDPGIIFLQGNENESKGSVYSWFQESNRVTLQLPRFTKGENYFEIDSHKPTKDFKGSL